LATRFTIEDEQFGQTFPLLSDFSMDDGGECRQGQPLLIERGCDHRVACRAVEEGWA
jgi:hypothetical protein